MLKVLVVDIGGSIGAASRYLVSNWAAERFGNSFPYGTLIVNVVGCFYWSLSGTCYRASLATDNNCWISWMVNYLFLL